MAAVELVAGDGDTIAGINLPHGVLQPLEGTVSYKTDDLTPVYGFHDTPDALIVASDCPYRTWQELTTATMSPKSTGSPRRAYIATCHA